MRGVTSSGGTPNTWAAVAVWMSAPERVAAIAREALLRPLGESSADPYYAGMERELLERINASGIGPQGLGGRTTALAVHVLARPTHIAMLPAAVCICCHAARHAEVAL